LSVKEDSEVQHVLAHLWLALEHLAKDEKKAALYELDSIAGLIFFDNDAERVAYLETVNYGKEETPPETPEPMPQPETTQADEDSAVG